MKTETAAEKQLRAHYERIIADRDRIITNLRARLVEPAPVVEPATEHPALKELLRILNDERRRADFYEEQLYSLGETPVELASNALMCPDFS